MAQGWECWADSTAVISIVGEVVEREGVLEVLADSRCSHVERAYKLRVVDEVYLVGISVCRHGGLQRSRTSRNGERKATKHRKRGESYQRSQRRGRIARVCSFRRHWGRLTFG